MGESGKLKLGEACRACGHFRGLHANVRGCLGSDNCRCIEGQISILEHALSETDARLDSLVAIEAARGIFELSFRLTEAYQALDEDLKEQIQKARYSLLISLGVEIELSDA